MADQAEIGGVASAGKSLKRRDGVFISYARSDGKHFAGKLRDRLESAEGFRCWQDIIGLEGGRDWWVQIQAAIDQVEFLILVMTPAAMQSRTVRKEWRYARQQGVCVYPVIAALPSEFDALIADVPRWIRDAHFYDLGQDPDHFELGSNWLRFLNDLRSACEVPRVPFMADDLGIYVQRSREYDAVIDLLLDTERDEPRAITSALALKGAGGYGKTTLARAICHDERIQESFDDGILWVTLGEGATYETVQAQVEGLIRVLSPIAYESSTLEAAKTRLRELLADRDMLMVIDDVWNADHLRPFLQGGERVARLITTRMGETLPDSARRIDVNQMTGDEAFALLTVGLSDEQTAPNRIRLRQLTADLMEYPLPVKLANGILRERVNAKKQPLAKALDFVNELLAEYGLALNDRTSIVEAALRASLAQLEPIELERYKRLAIFFDDTEIPLITLQRLWDGRRAETELFCERLEMLSLLLRFDPAAGTARLHDVIRDYMLRQGGSLVPRHGTVGEQRYGVAESIIMLPMDMYLKTGGSVIDWQREFLDRYRNPGVNMIFREKVKPVSRWADLPPDESYLWDALAYHLIEAALGDELIETVLDLHYIAAKTAYRGTAKVEADIEVAAAFARLNERPQANALELLARNYRNMAHILARCSGLNDVLVTLSMRLSHLESLKPYAAAIEGSLTRPYILPQHLLPDLPHPALVRTLAGHSAWVNYAVFSRDGKLIASASQDQTIRVWDAHTGLEKSILTGHRHNVTYAAFDANSELLATASADRSVRVWNLHNARTLLTLSKHEAEVACVDFNQMSTLLVTASGTMIKLWDARSGDLVSTLLGHTGKVNSAVFSVDGRLITSASDDHSVRVWEVETGTELMCLKGHSAPVTYAAFSLDQHRIVSSSKDETVRVWDISTPDVDAVELRQTGWINSAEFSPDARQIVTASNDNIATVWDLAEGRKDRLTGHKRLVTHARFSPDGQAVVTSSWDGTVKIWDVRSHTWNEAVESTRHADQVTSVAFTPDGKCLASASRDNTIKLWDAAAGKELAALHGHIGYVSSVAFSPDGETLISSSWDETVKLWDVSKRSLRRSIEKHSGKVTSAVFSPDSRWIASGSWDRNVKVFDAATREERFTLVGHTRDINKVIFSPDSRTLLSASDDRSIRLWQFATGIEPEVLLGHTTRVTDASFNSDGSLIASGSWDKTVKIWETTTRREIFTFIGHQNTVTGVAFSPDGNRIASASWDATIRVWSLRTGSCLAVFHGDAGLSCCVWSPDGEHIVAGGEGGYLYWLRWVE